MKSQGRCCVLPLLLLLSTLGAQLSTSAQGTALTYQGQLKDSSGPATGLYDFTFTLFGANSGGSSVAGPSTNSFTGVTNGLFTVTLDFGAGVFNGSERWLEIGVRPYEGGAFTILSPRQKLTATPYAVTASNLTGTASAATNFTGALVGDVIGTQGATVVWSVDGQSAANVASGASAANAATSANLPNAIVKRDAAGNFSASAITAANMSGNGSGLTSLNASQLLNGTIDDARLSSNVALLNGNNIFTDSNRFNGVMTATHTNNQFGGTFTGTLAGNGAGLSNLLAAKLTGTISPTNIGAGSITTVMLATGAVGSAQLAVGAVGANQLASAAVTTAALATGAVTADKVAAVLGSFLLTITNPVPAELLFGLSVAAVGNDRFAVGAGGEAYLFNINGGLLTTFTNPISPGLGGFGSSVAAVAGDRVLIGASSQAIGGAVGGAAFLFTTNGALLTTFTNPTPAANDNFGRPVAALGNDRVLIGAHQDDTGATNAGAAYLFSTNGALLTTFTNPTPANNDFFGTSVAAVGSDRVLIGGDDDGGGGTSAGAAYLFNVNGTLLLTVTNPVPRPFASFGHSVATLGNDRLLIGEPSGGNGGAAYLFRSNGTLLTTFTNPAPGGNDDFGISVAAVGNDRVLIGAWQDDTGATNSGTAYLFSTNGVLLATFNNPTPAENDSFGSAVASVGNNRVLIGDFTDDTGAGNAGAAYLFTLESFTPGLVAEAVRSGAVTAANLDPTIGVWTRSGNNVYRSTGNVGIGTSNPEYPLDVAGPVRISSFGHGAEVLNLSTERSWAFRQLGSGAGTALELASIGGGGNKNFVINTTGFIGIGTIDPLFTLHVNGTAGKPGGGSWSVASDARLKKNIRPLAGALYKLLALHGVSFEYMDPAKINELSGERMGLVAQEVEKVFPDWVETGPDGYKRVTVRGLEALMVEALRELQQKQEANETKLAAELKRRDAENAELKRDVEELKALVNALTRELTANPRK